MGHLDIGRSDRLDIPKRKAHGRWDTAMGHGTCPIKNLIEKGKSLQHLGFQRGPPPQY